MRTMDKDCETTLHQYLKYYWFNREILM